MWVCVESIHYKTFFKETSYSKQLVICRVSDELGSFSLFSGGDASDAWTVMGEFASFNNFFFLTLISHWINFIF